MSIWGRIADRERVLTASRQHAKRLERELQQLRAQAAHTDHAHPLPRWGVDYAFDPHPIPGQLRRAGATFAARYVTGAGKSISRLEAENLSAAGIDVVAIFESTAGRARAGYGAGAQDAHAAATALDRLSRHAHGRPIYFACDFDASGAGQVGPVMEYLRGAVHAIGWHRVGLYAGIGPINAAHGLNRCKYLWQTIAWSGGQWSPHAQLRQTQVDRLVAGARVDIDKAVAADFGQWRA